VFSRWRALKDIEVAELVDHTFRWVEIKDFITEPTVDQLETGVWNIDGKLEMRVFGDVEGNLASDGVNGAVRRDFSAKEGDILQDSVCVYLPIVAGRTPSKVERKGDVLQIGSARVRRNNAGELLLESRTQDE
jgi:hypothetical protein